ncbi:hypothetical protein PS3A_00600 [Pseudomonas sp. 3A(2025)]
MKGFLSGLLLSGCVLSAAAVHADPRYRFEAYPASTVSSKALGQIDWKSSPDTAKYWKSKEAAEAVVGQAPDFAGHFVVTRYGCGSGCTATLFIDTNNGKIYKAPMNEASTEEGAYKPSSNLIFMSDYRYVGSGPQMTETKGVVVWNEKAAKFEVLHKDKPVRLEME